MSVFRVVTSALLFLLVLAMITFAVLNPEDRVDIHLGFGDYTRVPLVIALGVAFGVGVLFTLIFLVVYLVDLYAMIRALRKENRGLRRELTDLRNLPIEEEEMAPDPLEARAAGAES
jgi:uncharacterized integral membrane protein